MYSYVKEILISVLYWSLVNIFIVTVRFVGIDFFYEPRADMPLFEIYSVSLPGGLIFGLGWGVIEIIYNRVTSKKRRSFGVVVVSKTLIYTTLFIIIAFLASWPGMGSSEMVESYMMSAFTMVNFGLFIMAAFLFIFFKQMNKMFGPGILWQYLTGKYFNPKEEDRIFMFLDLKSSTAIAEKLSHVLYSKLIQDCFAELTDPVLACKGQIYQYVGDEVVITWKKEDGINNTNCLHFYYDFINRLESKKDYFLRSYKVFPEFKAGLSVGLVTVAEVGELKTEIAYHGDVLNTAARIEGYCSEFNKPLLASEALVQELEKNKEFIMHLIGEVQLRGKEGISRIYSCEKPKVDTA